LINENAVHYAVVLHWECNALNTGIKRALYRRQFAAWLPSIGMNAARVAAGRTRLLANHNCAANLQTAV
jgi:hypothetical protein